MESQAVNVQPAAGGGAGSPVKAVRTLDVDSSMNRGGVTSTSEATTLAPKVLDAAQNAPAADKLQVEGMNSAEAATAGEERALSSVVKVEKPAVVAASVASPKPQDVTGDESPAELPAPQDPTVSKEGGEGKEQPDKWTAWEEKKFFSALKDCGSDFGKIADVIETRDRGQVRAFYDTEVTRINNVLAPLEVQVDPADSEEVHTAMHSWHCMKEKLGPGGSFQELCKKRLDKNLFAWELKKELDKSVWAEGKKEPKLKSLGLLPATTEPSAAAPGTAGAGSTTGAADNKHAGVKAPGSIPVKTTTNRGRPKGTSSVRAGKNTCKSDSPASRNKAAARKAARRGSASPNATAARANAASNALKAGGPGAADVPMAKEQKERLMMQLFPIDPPTRAALVAGRFNPHLELTMRAKKSVTGLMQHLETKWAVARPHLPAHLIQASVLQLYPFEATSAGDARGAWNGHHAGVTATDIFDALGRPAAFRVKYGWVPEAEAALKPHLAPPPPPVHQETLARSNNRTPSPQNLSPRKRSAEEMAVVHPSFCQAPVQANAFGGIFGGGGGVMGGGNVAGPNGSVFGSDLVFGGGVGGGVGASGVGVGGGNVNTVNVVGAGADEFSLGFGAGDFSNMCRELGVPDMETSRQYPGDVVGGGAVGPGGVVVGLHGGQHGYGGMGGMGGVPGVASVAATAAGQMAAAGQGAAPLMSAAPGEFKGYAQQRQVISQFGAPGDASIGALLDFDSLTQMLGDVPDGAVAASNVQPGQQQPAGGPTSFAGMFGGESISDAIGVLGGDGAGSGGHAESRTKPALATTKAGKAKGEKKPRLPKNKATTTKKAQQAQQQAFAPGMVMPGGMVPGYMNPANGGFVPASVQQQAMGNAGSFFPAVPHHGER